MPTLQRNAALFALTGVLSLGLPGASAADDAEDDQPAPGGWIESVRAELKRNDYQAALEKLRAANDTGSADWNNLMGYSLRKMSPPNLGRAELHYQAALKIESQHKGALEYYGELKLMQKDKAGAQAMLERLIGAGCRAGCEQHDDLAQAIAAYR